MPVPYNYHTAMYVDGVMFILNIQVLEVVLVRHRFMASGEIMLIHNNVYSNL